MCDQTVTETIEVVQVQPTTTTIAVTLSDNTCDNNSTITAETSMSNMSPSSCDSEIQQCQMMMKKSLKLDLSHNNNEIKSIDTGSPKTDDDSSLKSPTSPRTCKENADGKIFLDVHNSLSP